MAATETGAICAPEIPTGWPAGRQQNGKHGYTDTRPASYEEHHLIPLELGGSPRDPKNPSPQPRNAPTGETASSKDTAGRSG